MVRASPIVVLIIIILIVAVVAVEVTGAPQGGSSNSTSLNPAGSPPVCAPLGGDAEVHNQIALSGGGASPSYDEQLWLAFAQNFTSLAYNVTAIAQNDTFGYGPTYLVNGLTDAGLWYQVGLAWTRPPSGPSAPMEFQTVYEVWNSSSGLSIFPSSGVAGEINFGTAGPGDSVLLSLSFQSGYVVMKAYDWRTKAVTSVDYPAFGASSFIGNGDRVLAFPTSLLTEWRHVLPYFCSDRAVFYTNAQVSLSSAWLRIDEWNFTGVSSGDRFRISGANAVLFSTRYEPVYLDSADFQSIESNGTLIYASAHQFVTM